jgi:hypothetical protein
MGDHVGDRGRPNYWFPLVLLGFGLLALLAWESMPTAWEDHGWFTYAVFTDDQYFDVGQGGLTGTGLVQEQHSVSVASTGMALYPMRDLPWAVLVIGTVVATMAWYGWRARRAGGSARPFVIVAVGGGIAVVVAYVATGMASAVPDPAGTVSSVGLPLVGLGALAGAWAYLRPGRWRRATAMTSAICLLVGAGTVLGAWAPGLLEPVIITGGLLALARLERSRLLTVVALLMLATMLVFPPGSTLSMLVPAMVVLAAAIVILVRQGGTSEPAV